MAIPDYTRTRVWLLVRICSIEAMGALFDIPAQIVTKLDPAHFLPAGLAGISNQETELTTLIEGHPIGISQTIRVDFIQPIAFHERIAGRNAVRVARIDIYSEDITEQILLDVLAVPAGVEVVPILDVTILIVVGSPPSPSERYRYPSGPNSTVPPLWLNCGSSIWSR